MDKKKIETLLKKKVKEIFLTEIDFSLTWPKERNFGDFSTNFPLVAAKELKKEPKEVASLFIKKIEKDKEFGSLFEKVYFLNGFLNFFLSEKILVEKLALLFKERKVKKRERVILEFISANPTGELTLGNARGGFLGDSLARLLKKCGYEVFSEYYVNNAKNSLQIQELGKTFLGRGKSYLSDYLVSLIEKLKNERNKFKDEKEAGYFLAKIIQKENEDFIKNKLKIHFDNFFSEESLYQKKIIEKTLVLLKKRNLLYEKEGAFYLKTKSYGDEKDRVIIRSNGLPTYFLSDIAYHLTKIERGFRRMINVWGADHYGHKKRMMAALKSLGFLKKERLEIIIVQMVNLKRGQKKEKMSKRMGKYLSLKELIEEIGLDVSRFFFLMRSPTSQLDFDLSLVKEKSQKNPLYYLQYVWVRINGILKKSQEEKVDLANLRFEEMSEKELLRELIKFDDLKEEIAESLNIHQLVSWLVSLAGVFHRFYENCPVLVSQKEIRNSRLVLVKATKRVFQESLEILGVSLPEKM